MTIAQQLHNSATHGEAPNKDCPVCTPTITKTKRGFNITRAACVVCGEPPFGDEYCCGHDQNAVNVPKFDVGERVIACGKHPGTVTVVHPPDIGRGRTIYDVEFDAHGRVPKQTGLGFWESDLESELATEQA